jgi:hypothetical protein
LLFKTFNFFNAVTFYLRHLDTFPFNLKNSALVLDDLNHDILRNDGRIQEFKAAVEDLSLHIVSREPTNFHGAPSCIDLF